MKEKVILYGGSFDPLHNGHIALAKAASKYFDAPLIFVPAKNARWKENNATPEDRLRMINLVLEELNKDGELFSVSGYEIAKDGKSPSYSIDTVEYFTKECGSIYFLIGADQVNLFHKWKNAEKLAALANIVYVGRPNYKLSEENIKKYKMINLPFEEQDISSTDIRSFKSIEYPDVVRKYVETKKLYYFKDFLAFLKPTRLEHSISVANVALEIAKNNPEIDKLKAYKAGLLHDLGKYIPENDSRQIIRNNFSKEYEKYPIWALHQWTGAYIAKENFGIDDQEILDAIAYHCTGRPKMGPLEQVIYSADKIDPLRGYDSKPLIQSCLKDYHQGFIDVLSANREYLGKKKEKNPYRDDVLTQTCYKYFLDERKN